MTNKNLTFIDFFSGIGGFRLGLEMAGHKCLGHCEINKFANRSYKAMHNPKESEWFAEDITKVKPEDIPRADIWCGGFPCQDISVAGTQNGLRGARSGLFYEFTKLLKGKKEEDKPSLLFLENVKNLFSINGGWDFARILIELDEAGYDAEWQLLNSAAYTGQNRERLFIVGHLRGRRTRQVFPIPRRDGKALKQIVGGMQGNRVYDPSGVSCTLASQAGGRGAKTGLYLVNKRHDQFYEREGFTCIDANYHKEIDNHGARTGVLDVRACLTPDRAEKRQQGRRFKDPGEPMFTLTAQDRHGVYINGRIRRLTPRECFRLQGFPDEYFDRARAVNSDNQLYIQAGNSVTVPIIHEIASKFHIED